MGLTGSIAVPEREPFPEYMVHETLYLRLVISGGFDSTPGWETESENVDGIKVVSPTP